MTAWLLAIAAYLAIGVWLGRESARESNDGDAGVVGLMMTFFWPLMWLGAGVGYILVVLFVPKRGVK